MQERNSSRAAIIDGGAARGAAGAHAAGAHSQCVDNVCPYVVQDERGTDDACHARKDASPQTEDSPFLDDGAQAGQHATVLRLLIHEGLHTRGALREAYACAPAYCRYSAQNWRCLAAWRCCMQSRRWTQQISGLSSSFSLLPPCRASTGCTLWP